MLRLQWSEDIVIAAERTARQIGPVNVIFSILVDLLGEAFPVAKPTPASGRVIPPDCRSLRCRHWWRRGLGIGLFVLLAVLPFLLMGWF